MTLSFKNAFAFHSSEESDDVENSDEEHNHKSPKLIMMKCLILVIQIFSSQMSPSFEDLKDLYKAEKMHKLNLEYYQEELNKEIVNLRTRKEFKSNIQQLISSGLEDNSHDEQQLMSLAIGLVYIQSHNNVSMEDIVQVNCLFTY